jgi:hypothetical protein
MAMGLQPVAEADWLEFADDHAMQMAERRRLLREQAGDVLACLPEAQAASGELGEMLVGHLLRHHPCWFSRNGDRLQNALTGEQHDLAGAPLDLCGRLVQEDFCLLQPSAEGHVLTGAVLCFPSRWRLAEKLGLALPGVHGPVPFYGDRLAHPVERFFQSLKPGRIVQRLNWSVMDDPALFQPGGHHEAEVNRDVTAGNALQRLYLRVERQTFRKLPQSQAVAFGIRIHVTPLAEVVRVPGEGERLRGALAALPPEMALYKSAGRFSVALQAALGKDRQ